MLLRFQLARPCARHRPPLPHPESECWVEGVVRAWRQGQKSLSQWLSTQATLPSGGHRAMPGDIFDSCTLGDAKGSIEQLSQQRFPGSHLCCQGGEACAPAAAVPGDRAAGVSRNTSGETQLWAVLASRQLTLAWTAHPGGQRPSAPADPLALSSAVTHWRTKEPVNTTAELHKDVPVAHSREVEGPSVSER